MTFLSDAGEQAIARAIASIEAISSAEVVVTVRPRARTAPRGHLAVAIACASATLGFTLFSDVEFSLWQIFTLPVLAGLTGALVVESIPAVYRALISPHERSQRVRDAAHTAFVEGEVHATRGRTGILVFVALREQDVELIADLGVLERHGVEQLAVWAGQLEAALPAGAAAFADRLATLAPALAASLPRAADDVDELSNAVHVLGPPPRHARGRR